MIPWLAFSEHGNIALILLGILLSGLSQRKDLDIFLDEH